jgi:hypothetical protein
VLKKKVEIVPIDGFELRELFQMKQKLKWVKILICIIIYNDYKINAKEIVVINEEFSFSRNTKIMININNEVVYEF